MKSYIELIPKAELHLHIEGTLEPELAFRFAERNGIKLPYASVDALREAYNFKNLQEFLDLYHACSQVLVQEQDFYDLTWEYLKKLHEQNVCHVEIFYDSQSHTDRGLAFETVTNGIHRALVDGEKEFGISSYLILCFLRHLSEEAAMATLDQAVQHKDKIHGIGLASSEIGHPPSKFERAFDRVRAEGWHIVAHAGEEGPKEYIWEAIDLLKVERIDHGNRSMDDPELLKLLVERQIPLTLCPISNLELCVINDIADHPVKKMLDMGIMATIHSDDPAYFKGSLVDNYSRTAKALDLSKADIYRLAQNSFKASFLPEARKMELLEELATQYQPRADKTC
ncbi:MAG: adenosine deaminase [Bacteroidia bacterium]|nr:adenosine deaminase [Bacteroidia bacterium]